MFINICMSYSNKMNANEKYKYDQIKLDILRNEGFKVLEVWDSEYRKNPDNVLNQCMKFIYKGVS